MVIDLSGPQGNAFAILGMTQRALRQLRKSPDEVAKIMEEATEGDYKHLLGVVKRELPMVMFINGDEEDEG